MALISTKLVQQIAIAISNSQSAHQVVLANHQIKQLRQRPDYERGLAAFLSQSIKTNDKLMALLQLKLLAVLTEQHVILTLKELYFQDVQKVASIIKSLMCYPLNTHWTSILLDCNFKNMGGLALIRYIELVFCLLTDGQKTVVTINYGRLRLCFLQLIESVAQSQLMMRMVTITLALFYEIIVERDLQSLEIIREWYQFDIKSKFYQSPVVAILKQIIDDILRGNKSNFPDSCLGDMLSSVLTSMQRNNEHQLKYDSQELRFICRNCHIFHCKQSVFTFVSTFVQFYRKNIKQMLQSVVSEGCSPTVDCFINQQQTASQQLIYSVLKQQICEIFTHHLKILNHGYEQAASRPLFVYLLPLITFYDSTDNSSILQWIQKHINCIVDHIGYFLSHLEFQNRRQEQDILDFVCCWQFVMKYKNLIDIKMIAHICNLLQKISLHFSPLSSFCYTFADEVWQTIATLGYNQLYQFLAYHLKALNQNCWDHKFDNYSCFLHLSQYLQQTYQSLVPHQQLYQQSVKAQQIMVQLLSYQNVELKDGELTLFILLIGLTSSLLGQEEKMISVEKCKTLGIDKLHTLVVRYKLEDCDSLKVERLFQKVESIQNRRTRQEEQKEVQFRESKILIGQ